MCRSVLREFNELVWVAYVRVHPYSSDFEAGSRVLSKVVRLQLVLVSFCFSFFFSFVFLLQSRSSSTRVALGVLRVALGVLHAAVPSSFFVGGGVVQSCGCNVLFVCIVHVWDRFCIRERS